MKNLLIILLLVSSLAIIACSTKTPTGNVILEDAAEITAEELSSHNSKSDCWVSFQGKVYDITSFLEVHKAPLSKYCGTSDTFESAFTKTHGDAKIATLEKAGTLKGELV